MSNSSRTRSNFSGTKKDRLQRPTIFLKPTVSVQQITKQSDPKQTRAHQNARNILAKQGLKVQAKRKIGDPNDKMEKEADSMADLVMSMPQRPPPNEGFNERRGRKTES